MDDRQRREVISILRIQVNIIDSLLKTSDESGHSHQQTSLGNEIDKLQINVYQSMDALVDQSGAKRADGDIFDNISENVAIVNRSVVAGAENSLRRTRGDESADSFRRLAQEVERSNCEDACICLNSLAEELLKSPPKGVLVRMLIAGIFNSAPEIDGIVDVVDLQKLP